MPTPGTATEREPLGPLVGQELSRETWPDFAELFGRVGSGWCGCMLYRRGRHLPLKTYRTRDARLAQNLAETKELVDQDRAHGIIVYAGREPVGWVEYGPVDELPLDGPTPPRPGMRAHDPTSQWRITCFVTRRDLRRRGIATLALTTALESIGRGGGGWVEAVPIAGAFFDGRLTQLKRIHGPHAAEVIEHRAQRSWPEVDVPGLGPVPLADGHFGNVSHPGTVTMFARQGFATVRRIEPAGVLMRRHLAGVDPT